MTSHRYRSRCHHNRRAAAAAANAAERPAIRLVVEPGLEAGREAYCLRVQPGAIEVARSFTARDVIMTLQYLFAVRGAPEHLRSDNGPEFVAKEIQEWLARACVRTPYIQNAFMVAVFTSRNGMARLPW